MSMEPDDGMSWDDGVAEDMQAVMPKLGSDPNKRHSDGFYNLERQ